ncbi:uncharacterized [Tachysurus ichikawai]
MMAIIMEAIPRRTVNIAEFSCLACSPLHPLGDSIALINQSFICRVVAHQLTSICSLRRSSGLHVVSGWRNWNSTELFPVMSFLSVLRYTLRNNSRI